MAQNERPDGQLLDWRWDELSPSEAARQKWITQWSNWLNMVKLMMLNGFQWFDWCWLILNGFLDAWCSLSGLDLVAQILDSMSLLHSLSTVWYLLRLWTMAVRRVAETDPLARQKQRQCVTQRNAHVQREWQKYCVCVLQQYYSIVKSCRHHRPPCPTVCQQSPPKTCSSWWGTVGDCCRSCDFQAWCRIGRALVMWEVSWQLVCWGGVHSREPNQFSADGGNHGKV